MAKYNPQGMRFQERRQEAIEGEVAEMHPAPDNIPPDVWRLIQDNGRIATRRLNELLTSARFHRLKASEQAKLISLAQTRAYGAPQAATKRVAKTVLHINDATAAALPDMASRTSLPEYASNPETRPVSDLQEDLGSDRS